MASPILIASFNAFLEILREDYLEIYLDRKKRRDKVYCTELEVHGLLEDALIFSSQPDIKAKFSFLNNIPVDISRASIDAFGREINTWLFENDEYIGVLATLDVKDVIRISLEEDRGRLWSGIVAMIHLIKEVTMLDLSHFEIGRYELVMLMEALSYNESLLSLNLSHNRIDDGHVALIAKYLAGNTSLALLDLSHNEMSIMKTIYFRGYVREILEKTVTITFNSPNKADTNETGENSESIVSATSSAHIGPETIDGWGIKNVSKDGNCLYHAFVEQVKRLRLPFLERLPEQTEAHSWLRFRVADRLKQTFEDGEWAGDEAIHSLVALFNVIVVMVDTRFPEQGYYIALFLDENQEVYELTVFDENKKIPEDERPIIRLATTSTHYMSVLSNPVLTEGVIREAFGYTPSVTSTQAASSTSYRFFPIEPTSAKRNKERDAIILREYGLVDGYKLIRKIESLGAGDSARFYEHGVEIPRQCVVNIQQLQEELSQLSEYKRFTITSTDEWIQINCDNDKAPVLKKSAM